MAERIISIAISLLIALPQPAMAALPPANESQQQPDVLKALDSFETAATKFLSIIDTAAFDPETMLDRLNFEAEEIVRFAKEGIGFDQYPGLLRGVKGTLMSRSGNALDQSILLARLLKDAGYDARIVGATLTTDQARRLLDEMGKPHPKLLPIAKPAEFIQVIEELSNQTLGEEERSQILEVLKESSVPDEERQKSFTRSVELITTKLKEVDINLSGAPLYEEMLAEARDYYWVQIKPEQASGWVDTHPAVSEDDFLEGLTPETFFSDEIPESLQHRMRFQVYIEVKRGEELTQIPITSPWERPTANLNGVPLTFSNIPDTLAGGQNHPLELETALEQASSFMPAFNGGLAEGGKFFDLRGNVIDPMVARDQAAGLFQSLNKAIAGATGALGGESAVPTLTAQWMEFTLIAPGGKAQTIRRMVFDRIGAENRAKGNVKAVSPTTPTDARTLLQRNTFMISTGRTPQGLAIHFTLSNALKAHPAFSKILRKLKNEEIPTTEDLKGIKDLPPEWPGHLTLFSLLDQAESAVGQAHTYRSGPSLVLYRDGLAAEEGFEAVVDILTNPRRSTKIEGGHVTADPYVTLAGGVWETAYEGAVVPPGEIETNTSRAIDEAKTAEVNIRVLLQPSQLEEVSVTDNSKFFMREDLAADYAVIVPEITQAGKTTGWWRVNVHSGETLGRIGDGGGATATEYLGMLSFGISVAFLVASVANCLTQVKKDKNYDKATCCVYASFLFFGIGYFGGALAASQIPAVTAGTPGALHLIIAQIVEKTLNLLMHLSVTVGALLWDILTYVLDACGMLGYE